MNRDHQQPESCLVNYLQLTVIVLQIYITLQFNVILIHIIRFFMK